MSPKGLNVLRQAAENIDTGLDAPETSRALVVFNTTHEIGNGTAVYHAQMPWRRGVPLPPIMVTQWDGAIVPSWVSPVQRTKDERDRPDREQIAFDIFFSVKDVYAQGWKTYLAWFTDQTSSEEFDEAPRTPRTGFVVIETTRHGGHLPTSGTF
ncbi:MAG: hypothetical protein ABIY70_24590 [Capsulimonas sp.]|uniref:hypothetical protein n=1 Tax=Capsulimonas sp. TaxID=2494211 RepID=UPI003265ED52